MNTIYLASANDLIAQPRSATSFPSGLVRVDQVYFGLTANSATNRANLAVGSFMPDGDDSPAIQWEFTVAGNTQYEPSLKIFPEVPERRREDGFTEYTVSAYGQINSEGSIRRGLSIERYTKNFSENAVGDDPGYQWTITEFWEIETVTILKTIRSSDSLESFTQPAGTFFKKLRNRRITGNRPPDGDSNLNLIFNVALLSAQRTNFGHIDEVALTWGNEAFV
jgi:hypothetical protein